MNDRERIDRQIRETEKDLQELMALQRQEFDSVRLQLINSGKNEIAQLKRDLGRL